LTRATNKDIIASTKVTTTLKTFGIDFGFEVAGFTEHCLISHACEFLEAAIAGLFLETCVALSCPNPLNFLIHFVTAK
jgi:hypothetical protein